MHPKLEVNLKLANHEWNLKFTAMRVNPTNIIPAYSISTWAECYSRPSFADKGIHLQERKLCNTITTVEGYISFSS